MASSGRLRIRAKSVNRFSAMSSPAAFSRKRGLGRRARRWRLAFDLRVVASLQAADDRGGIARGQTEFRYGVHDHAASSDHASFADGDPSDYMNQGGHAFPMVFRGAEVKRVVGAGGLAACLGALPLAVTNGFAFWRVW